MKGKLLQNHEDIDQTESSGKIVTGKSGETTAQELVAGWESREGGAGQGEVYWWLWQVPEIAL